MFSGKRARERENKTPLGRDTNTMNAVVKNMQTKSRSKCASLPASCRFGLLRALKSLSPSHILHLCPEILVFLSFLKDTDEFSIYIMKSYKTGTQMDAQTRRLSI